MIRSGRRTATVVASLVTGALVLAGCSGAADGDAGSPAGPADELSGDLTIFAAASLSGVFDEFAAAFEQQHPHVDVLPITYDGSSTLATQISEGAAADVFASADEPNMDRITDLAADPRPFATNVLEIAVGPGNPTGVAGVADLADGDRVVVVCAAAVPCGAAAHTLLDAEGIDLSPASEEQNVTAVLAKVKSGEADAGLVYRTDVAAAGGAVDGIQIPDAERAPNVYPLTALTSAANPDAAEAFVDFVLSDEARAVLVDFGFGTP